jgi:hypothetical protein
LLTKSSPNLKMGKELFGDRKDRGQQPRLIIGHTLTVIAFKTIILYSNKGDLSQTMELFRHKARS